MTSTNPCPTNAIAADDKRGTCGHQIRRGERMSFGFNGAGRAISVICADCANEAERTKVPTHAPERFAAMDGDGYEGCYGTIYVASTRDFGPDPIAAYFKGRRTLCIRIGNKPQIFVQTSINLVVAEFRSISGDLVQIFND